MKGFTIVELLLTVAMIAIITGMAIPLYSISQSKDDLETESSMIAGAVRSARIFSTSGKENSEWGFHVETGKLIIFKGTSYSSRDISFDEELQIGESIVFSGLNDVYFTKLYGIPNTTGSLVLTIPDGSTKNIEINGQGTISY
jgi:prepilin-type N-terminal cleavage/methylation domain-containing protein